jgi:DNA-binding protein HU-beta
MSRVGILANSRLPGSRLTSLPSPSYHEDMNKEAFIKHLAQKNRRSQNHYRAALSEILDGLKEKLADGKEIQLLGFGRFYTRTHKGGKGRNFKTGEVKEYKPMRVVEFHPGDLLKKAVRKKKGLFG